MVIAAVNHWLNIISTGSRGMEKREVCRGWKLVRKEREIHWLERNGKREI